MSKEQIIDNLNYQNEKFFGGQSETLTEAIKALEQQPSDDCVDRNHVIATISQHHFDKDKDNFDLLIHNLCKEIKNLSPVTPTQCIATVQFNKEELRDICNERIEIACQHGTCKDCEKNMGICLKFFKAVKDDFYCKDFKGKGDET